MNALVFLYRKIPEQPLDGKIDAVRARKKRNAPVVLAGDEVASVVSPIKGTPRIAVEPLHGGGPGTGEAIRSRVHDIDHDLREIIARSGKGDKDRVAAFPASPAPLLRNHLATVKTIYKQDISQGCGGVNYRQPVCRSIKMKPRRFDRRGF